MLLCFSTWLINCFNADKYYLENAEWLNSSSLFLASFPAPHLNDCRPYPTSFLMLGSCCQLSSPLAHDCLICLHLLLAGFPSMKIPIPILTHQDPQPLWKTKLIPFHLPSPTADSPLLLTQTWVWHPKLVRLSTRPSCFLWKLVLFLLSFPSKSSSYFHISVKSECEWWLVQLLKIKFVETLFGEWPFNQFNHCWYQVLEVDSLHAVLRHCMVTLVVCSQIALLKHNSWA